MSDPNALLMEAAEDADLCAPDGLFDLPKKDAGPGSNGQRRNGKLPSSEILDSVPPHSVEAEQDLTGSLIVCPEHMDAACGIVSERMFYTNRAKILFRIMQSLFNARTPINGTSLIDALGENELEEVGGKAYIATRVHEIVHVSKADIRYYAETVRDKWKLRMANFAAQSALRAGYEPGADGAAILEALRNAVDDIHASTLTSAEFSYITAKQLAEHNAQVEWIFPGVQPLRQQTTIGGVSKTVKTGIACDMADAITTGGDFLGQFSLAQDPMPVLFHSCESGYPTLRETFERIADSQGRTLAENDLLCVLDRRLLLGDKAKVAGFRKILRDFTGGVWFIDPWFMFSGLDAAGSASNSVAGERLGVITDLAGEFDITPVLLAHCRKPGKREGGKAKRESSGLIDIHDLSGAGLAEWTRAWILVNREGEYEDGSGHHVLNLRCGGSAGHSSAWQLTLDEGEFVPGKRREWRTSIQRYQDAEAEAAAAKASTTAQAKEEQKTNDVRSVLLAISEIAPENKTNIRTKAKVPGGGTRFYRAWNFAVEENYIRSLGMRKKGDKGAKSELFELTEQGHECITRTEQDN